ncbi:hypothetical protein [Polaribacter atrinae]|nr:hypothetical protein [Polaribacter atrinae]
MTDKEIKELININLNVLGNRNDKRESYHYFIDIKGERIDSVDIQPKVIANYMERYGLISIYGEFCTLTSNGIRIYENKGWLKYLNETKEKETSNKNKEIRKETQEEIIRKGTIESFEYGKWGFYTAIIALIVSILTLLLK